MKLDEPVWLFEYTMDPGGYTAVNGKAAVMAKTYGTAYQRAVRIAMKVYRTTRSWDRPTALEIALVGKYEVSA